MAETLIQQDRTATLDAAVEETFARYVGSSPTLVSVGQSRLHGICVDATAATVVRVYDFVGPGKPGPEWLVAVVRCPAGDARTVWLPGGVSVQEGLWVEFSGTADIVVYYSVR